MAAIGKWNFCFCLLLFVLLALAIADDLNVVTQRQGYNAQQAGGFKKAASDGGRDSSKGYTRLADDPACAEHVKRYCRNQNPNIMNDLAVLECLQNNVPKEEELSDACQHSLWMTKKKLSNDIRFVSAVGAVCQVDLKKLPECDNLDVMKNFLIPCLIDNLDNITVASCKNFLSRMESIVFSDYRLIYKFVESCQNDISNFQCGRLYDDESKKSIHDQGDTITCLSGNLSNLRPECKKQILRVAELQGSDYHNDRQLFFACQDDRERFCAQVMSGNGRVYNCLAAHKFNPQMSKGCQDRLTVRQQLQRADYKVNRGLTVACRAHIMNEKCVHRLQQTPTSGLMEARLSIILLCLENATKSGHQLDPDCLSEIVAVRKNLMADYRISPEIVGSCGTEIRERCNNGLERDGKTIHCLMGLARSHLRLQQQSNEVQRQEQVPSFKMTLECQKALGFFLKEVDVRENYEIDPVLKDACGSVVRTRCSNIQPGQGKVIDCLMSFVDKRNVMSDDCKNRLMETQYFVSRDFELSPGFYKACGPAIASCRVSESPRDSPEERQSHLLLCIYRMREKSGVAGACAAAVKQVMIDRAKSVDLEPAIEAKCLNDLSHICSDKTDKNEEMDCLEEHLQELEEDCQKVVKKYVAEEDEAPEFSQLFMKACEPVLKDQCKDAASGGKDAEGDSLMNCLIKFKWDTEMPAKCRAGIENHQLMTLKDFTLSHDFKEACGPEVGEHCSRITTKYELVSCLSNVILNDTLFEASPRISPKCKKQMKFELLQRSESIKFDPELKQECENDLKRFCNNVTPGKGAQINCLRSNQEKLEPRCHKFVFKRERQEVMDPTTDFALMTKCKRMIKKYCENEIARPAAIFPCLRKYKNEEDFDKGCFRVVVQRQRTRALDIRLNPDLMKDCKADIMSHCQKEFSSAKTSDIEVEGMVIGCLRAEFAKQAKTLTDACSEHIKEMIKESALDYMQDVALAKQCHNEIVKNCSEAVALDRSDPDRGAVEECLRGLMMKTLMKTPKSQSPCWKEVVRVLSEDKADVQVDPLLYKACSTDLLHVCKDVARGEGRQMSCLVDALSDKSVKLRPECKRALGDRVNLWNKAMEVAPFESFAEMVDQVSSSPARNYLMTVIIVIIGVIFIGGLFCGRITKRIARQVKDR